MKALVTGGAGFIGYNLIKRLLQDGHEVVSVDNYSTGKKENEHEGCTYYNYDISSSHTIGIYVDHGTYPSWRDDEYDVIFHLAALPRIQPSFKNPVRTFDTNVIGTRNILELVRKQKNCQVIFAGSSSTHGGVYRNPYTFTKWQSEELCKLYYKVYGVNVSIYRFYNVYGDRNPIEGEYCTVLGIFERQFSNNEPLTITGDGEQRRDFTHVDDIVEGMMLGWRSQRIGQDVAGQEYELGSGYNYSINEVTDMFGWTEKSEPYPTEYIDERPGEVRETKCDFSKAYKELGYTPENNLVDYITDFKLRKTLKKKLNER